MSYEHRGVPCISVISSIDCSDDRLTGVVLILTRALSEEDRPGKQTPV